MLPPGVLHDLEIDPEACRAEAGFLAETAEGLAEEVEAPWARAAIRGHAFGEAAERALLTDLDLGAELARGAGAAYRRAGLPYGLALAAAFAPPDDARRLLSEAPEIATALAEDAEAAPAEGRGAAEGSLLPAALRRPEQAAYLLLALAADAAVWGDQRRLRARLVERIAREAHLPLGPLGVPAATHLALFEGLDDRSAAAAEALAEMMETRRRKLLLARRSGYLWRRLWLPFAYADLHLVCLGRAILAVLGPAPLMPWLRRDDAASTMTALPLRVALAIKEGAAPEAGAF